MWLVATVPTVSSLQGGLLDSTHQLRVAVGTDIGGVIKGLGKISAAVAVNPFTSWPLASPRGSQIVAI